VPFHKDVAGPLSAVPAPIEDCSSDVGFDLALGYISDIPLDSGMVSLEPWGREDVLVSIHGYPKNLLFVRML
jgi:hypothetical protein